MKHARLTRLLLLRVAPALVERLARVADVRGVSSSDVAREGILIFLEREESRLGLKKSPSPLTKSLP